MSWKANLVVIIIIIIITTANIILVGASVICVTGRASAAA